MSSERAALNKLVSEKNDYTENEYESLKEDADKKLEDAERDNNLTAKTNKHSGAAASVLASLQIDLYQSRMLLLTIIVLGWLGI